MAQGQASAGARARRAAITVAILGALAAAVWWLLPQPYPADLSRIGQGRPALVLVYDGDLVVSGDQAAELDAARDALQPGMELLVANTGRPDAARFIAQHDARPGMLLLFDADGALIERLSPVVPAEKLRRLAD